MSLWFRALLVLPRSTVNQTGLLSSWLPVGLAGQCCAGIPSTPVAQWTKRRGIASSRRRRKSTTISRKREHRGTIDSSYARSCITSTPMALSTAYAHCSIELEHSERCDSLLARLASLREVVRAGSLEPHERPLLLSAPSFLRKAHFCLPVPPSRVS